MQKKLTSFWNSYMKGVQRIQKKEGYIHDPRRQGVRQGEQDQEVLCKGYLSKGLLGEMASKLYLQSNNFISEIMIKKLTPSKNFGKHKRQSSCCNPFCGEDYKQEKLIELKPRPLPIHIHPNLHQSPKKKELSLAQQIEFQTPKASFLQTRTNSLNKTYLLSTATLSHYPFNDAFLSTRQEEPEPNPLQRLKLRLTGSNASQHYTESSSTNNNRIAFNPNPQENQENFQPSRFLPPTIHEQKDIESRYIQQIEEYKLQYRRLLEQFQHLKREKSDNKQHFQHLLSEILKKQNEIRQLERIRREEVRLLREEVESFIKGRTYQQ